MDLPRRITDPVCLDHEIEAKRVGVQAGMRNNRMGVQILACQEGQGQESVGKLERWSVPCRQAIVGRRDQVERSSSRAFWNTGSRRCAWRQRWVVRHRG